MNPEILPNLERPNVKFELKTALTRKYVVKHIFNGVYSTKLPMSKIRA